MHAGDAVDDREPKSRADGAARFIHPGKWLKHAFRIFRRNAGAAIEHRQAHASRRRGCFDFHFGAAVAQRVFNEVGDDPLHRHAVQLHARKRARACGDVAPLTGVALDHRFDDLVQVGVAAVRRFRRDACEIEKLIDHGIDVLDVLHHAGADRVVGLVIEHFDAEPDSCERRAQIVRDAGEQQGALGVRALQIGRHLVERTGKRAHFRRPGFSDPRGHFTAPDGGRGARQFAQRLIDPRDDGEGAGERQQQYDHAPADPAQLLRALDALARHAHPVFEIVDRETDPQAVQAVLRAEQLGVGAEPALQFERDQPDDRPVGERFDRLVRRVRIDLDAFLLREVAQQVQALGGIRCDERRAREVDDAGDLLRDLHRARFALGGTENFEGGEVPRDHQHREQQYRAPQQAARQQRHAGLPSGMKT